MIPQSEAQWFNEHVLAVSNRMYPRTIFRFTQREWGLLRLLPTLTNYEEVSSV